MSMITESKIGHSIGFNFDWDLSSRDSVVFDHTVVWLGLLWLHGFQFLVLRFSDPVLFLIVSNLFCSVVSSDFVNFWFSFSLSTCSSTWSFTTPWFLILCWFLTCLSRSVDPDLWLASNLLSDLVSRDSVVADILMT